MALPTFGGTNNPAPLSDVPQDTDIDPATWQIAEDLVRSRNGGFAGVSEQGKYNQIKEAYDQIVENNKKATAWEGK
jgi:hypothetical protein